MGVAVHVLGLEAHPAEHDQHLLVQLARPGQMVQLEPQPHQVADRLAGVEGGVGVLEDELDVAGPLKGLLAREPHQAFSVEQDLPGGDGGQPHHGPAQGGLAAAGLAHQPEDLAPAQVQADPAQGLDPGPVLDHDPFPDGEMNVQLLDLEQLLGRSGLGRGFSGPGQGLGGGLGPVHQPRPPFS